MSDRIVLKRARIPFLRLMMIANGAQGMIVKRKLPYAIKKKRNGAAVTLGLGTPWRRLMKLAH